MDKKENMKQTLSEMFGVGTTPSDKETDGKTDEAKSRQPLVTDKTTLSTATVANAPKTYCAPGTVMEGTLRAKGDVEFAGELKGDITTTGNVVLHSVIQGNITADNLSVSGCKLTGDVVVNNQVIVSQDSVIYGNITAREVVCCGHISGDLKVAETISLENTAKIIGNIIAESLSVSKGAEIQGSIEIKTNTASAKSKSVQL